MSLINSTSSISISKSSELAASVVSSTPQTEKVGGRVSFKNVLDSLSGHEKTTQIGKLDRLLGPDLGPELTRAQADMLAGKTLQPEQILALQIKVHHLGLRVELVSKLSESVMSTVRKLQNQQ